MDAQFLCKKVPWSQLEEYLTVHKRAIETYLDLYKVEAMDKATIETLLPKSFWLLHQAIAKIIKDNNLAP